MAEPEPNVVEVSALAGAANPPIVRFTVGVPAAPTSVGTHGQWPVIAEGVAPVHLFLAFDGQTLHVAATPNVTVLLAGAPVGTSWTPAPLPSELRFGGACLILRQAAADASTMLNVSTVSDNGALFRAAQRAVEAARSAQHGMPQPPPAPPPSSRKPALVDFSGTVRMQHAEGHSFAPPATEAPRGEGSPPSTARMPNAPPRGAKPSESPEPKKKNAWQQASNAKRATWILMPFALLSSYVMLRDGAKPPPRLVAPAASSVQAATSTSPSPGSSAATSPATSASAQPATVAGTLGASVDAGAGAAADAGSPAPSLDASSPVRPASASAPAPSTPRARVVPTKGRKTPEREALDAVASGTFQEAAKEFEALANAHPDDPNFKDAARVLRAKSGVQ